MQQVQGLNSVQGCIGCRGVEVAGECRVQRGVQGKESSAGCREVQRGAVGYRGGKGMQRGA